MYLINWKTIERIDGNERALFIAQEKKLKRINLWRRNSINSANYWKYRGEKEVGWKLILIN
jgi:hypothetical protein